MRQKSAIINVKKGGDQMSRRMSSEIKEENLGKVQAGERVANLAKQYAVSTKTIYGWLRQEGGEAVVNRCRRGDAVLK